MPSSSRWPNDPTSAWAQDVVDGEIVAGELVRLAAERHLRDIRDGAARGLHWRPEKAARALAFFPAVLSITEGAKAGKPFHPLPWHTFAIGSLFGWRTASDRMRWRSAWMETGKGQAKSPLMAGVGLYMMGWYGVPRAKIFAIGQDRNTANVLFKDAAAMCRAPIPVEEGEEVDDGDTLEANGDVIIRGEGDNAWKIEHPETGSLFQALANGDAPSGPKPTLVCADEIHEFKSNTSLEIWRAAIAKMPGDALMMLGTNTPASTQFVGTDYSELYQKVARGEIRDDEAFSFIARVDKADRETVFDNEACWQKALPALGITFPIENIRGQVNTARQMLSTALFVKRLYFGIPIGASEFWIAEEAWNAVQGEVDPETLKGCKCWLSLDLSQKNDLTALTAVWLGPDGRLYVKTWYWTTKDGLADRVRKDQAPYDLWVEQKYLTAVDGAVIDKTFVAAEVARICAEHDVEFMAFDSAGMADFEAACEHIGFETWRFKGPDEPQGAGLKLVAHGQGTRVIFEDKALSMPRSIERLEDRILKKSIVIDRSPVTYSCAANAHVISDGMKNRAFDKKRSRGRIDGMVTVAMGVGAALNEMGGGSIDFDDLIRNAVVA
ncbi:terminase large subunit [Aureimonas phyllosphaerae]|uniref:Phage terminase large subunit-like protein n=1 Tax=Aureimonas phyllosphaerae TaxID=1166078 RepID=A0A7W6FW01_9HYPH|nr:terminase TerL endonuclease subunit [Aureimonas phyllosphaerae]MBB3937683.1 phage terminase large subunit-like protein [Aureimonas phyllosphaerae]MBB3961782.1 phage terminase large subunit-like protein [Aureimonas phyllosphaerae]SFF45044.1 Phage terminase-like protein, large subunit, contains N-terminal HTH domain [Aureimonas phyllosphaerae]